MTRKRKFFVLGIALAIVFCEWLVLYILSCVSTPFYYAHRSIIEPVYTALTSIFIVSFLATGCFAYLMLTDCIPETLKEFFFPSKTA